LDATGARRFKLNTDGAFLQESCTGATGAVLRGSDGRFRAASARWMNSVGSALLAEAEALRDGVRLIPEGTQAKIVAETDSLELVSLWQKRRNQRSEVPS
jgi:ribonuclease HI